MIALRDALDRALRSVRLQNVSTLAKINADWENIVGQQLAGVCQPAYIAKNTLFIHVYDRAFLAPLDYARRKVLEKTHAVIGKDGNIQNVAVTYAERPHTPPSAGRTPPATGPIAPADERRISAAVAQAAEPELKEALARLFRAGAACGRKSAALLAVCLMPMLAACVSAGKPSPAPSAPAAAGEPAEVSPADAALKTETERKGYSHYLYAQMLIAQNKLPEALQELRNAVKDDPGAMPVYLDMSRVSLAMGNYREAIDTAQEGLVVNPDYAPLNALLGTIYQSSQNYAQAEKYYKKALEKDPARADIRLGLAVNYMEMKRYDDAERELLKGLKDDPQSQSFIFYLSRIYVEQKQYFKAEEFLTTLIRQYPNFTKAYETLGWVYLAQEKYDLAVDIYKKYLESDPSNEVIQQRLANVYLMKKDYGHALDVYKEIEKTDPGTIDLALKMGLIHFQRGEWKEALEKFQLIKLKDPANHTVPYYIARVYEEIGLFNESLKVWDELAATMNEADATEVFVHMAGIYEKLGQLDNTQAMLEKALSKKPDDPDVHYLMGVILVKKEDYPAAVKSLNRAIELAPTRADFIFYLGATYEKMKNMDKCETLMRKVLELNPAHADAMNYIAYLYAVQNRNLDEALQLINRALESEANNGYYLDTLSWIYYRQGKLELALATIKKAIANTKEKDATVYDHLGDIHFALGNYDEAAEAFAVSVDVKSDPAVREKLAGAKARSKGKK